MGDFPSCRERINWKSITTVAWTTTSVRVPGISKLLNTKWNKDSTLERVPAGVSRFLFANLEKSLIRDNGLTINRNNTGSFLNSKIFSLNLTNHRYDGSVPSEPFWHSSGLDVETITSIVSKRGRAFQKILKEETKVNMYALIQTHVCWLLHTHKHTYTHREAWIGMLAQYMLFFFLLCSRAAHNSEPHHRLFVSSVRRKQHPSIPASPVAWLEQLGIKDPLTTDGRVAFLQLPPKGRKHQAGHGLYHRFLYWGEDERNVLPGECFGVDLWGEGAGGPLFWWLSTAH